MSGKKEEDSRIKQLETVFGKLNEPSGCFAWSKYFSKLIASFNEEEEEEEEYIESNIDNEKVSKVFAVFSETQNICHQLLKDAYENEKFNVKILTEISLQKIKLPNDEKESVYFKDIPQESTDNYGINYFFDKLVKDIKKAERDDSKNQLIIDLFNRLLNNTINFFNFVDTNICSICQYFKDVDERFCKDDNLIKMKKLFNSFNNLREPSQHLIHLYISMMIKDKIITEATGIEKENKAKDSLKPRPSLSFQQKDLEKVLEYIKQQGNDLGTFWAEGENQKILVHEDEEEEVEEEEEEEEEATDD